MLLGVSQASFFLWQALERELNEKEEAFFKEKNEVSHVNYFVCLCMFTKPCMYMYL